MVSGQLPPEENCPLLRVGVWVKVRVNQTSAHEENCPPVRVRVSVRANFEVGGNFVLGHLF